MSDTELLLAILTLARSIQEDDGGLTEVRKAVLDYLVHAATILWLQVSHEHKGSEGRPSSEGQ